MVKFSDLPNISLLEDYVLDRLGTAKRAAVEAIADRNPRTRAEIDRIERAIEYIVLTRCQPSGVPAGTLDSVLAGIKKLPRTSGIGDGTVHTL